ncbi:hypothetical protein [Micromonospora sp. URMC 103]
MSSRDTTPLVDPSSHRPTPPALTRRRHVDMMWVCSAACRPGAPR